MSSKKIFVLILVLAVGSVCGFASTVGNFYLSPEGSDSWSGKLPEPNSTRSDGPFLTLERARNAVRELKAGKAGDIVVLIRGGMYQLKRTVVFGVEDSAGGGVSITYAAYPGEVPVFSSGQKVAGWQKVTEKLDALPKPARGMVWQADVSERFYTLYDSRGMLPRARSKGFTPLVGSGRDRVRLPNGIIKQWDNVEGAEIVVRPHHAWMLNILPVVSVDENKSVAYTSIDSTYVMDGLKYLEGVDSCWVDNILEALDEAGEWVLNTKSRKLYLWSRDGLSPENILASRLKEYIRVEGKIDKMGAVDIPVVNLYYRGLTFMHGQRDTLTKDDKGLQHDWEMHDKATALVRLRGSENCVVEKCHFAHSGAGAVRVDNKTESAIITSNILAELEFCCVAMAQAQKMIIVAMWSITIIFTTLVKFTGTHLQSFCGRAVKIVW